MKPHVILTLISQQPSVSIAYSYNRAMEEAADLAFNQLGGTPADHEEFLREHGRIQEGDFEIWVLPADELEESPHTAMLKSVRNSLRPGPDRDKTLLDPDDFDTDGVPYDGDLWRICSDNKEAAHWDDCITRVLEAGN